MIETAKELVSACLEAATKCKTLYVMGCFGAPMTEKNKSRYISSYSFNQKDERAAKIRETDGNTFGFDCVCFIKGLLWGWTGDASQIYGGAVYKSNGVPDIGADQMLAVCTEVSEDFSKIVPGEYVWLPGHCGIYIGDGKAVEATNTDADGVQIQAVMCMGQIPGIPATDWKKHGKLPWVRYEAAEEERNYRVILEGLTAGEAEKFTDNPAEGWVVRVEEMATAPKETPVEPEWEPKVGDTVFFRGGLQYSQSNGTAGTQKEAGQATITKIFNGKHPYHLIRTGASGPYGWVDRDTFEKT